MSVFDEYKLPAGNHIKGYRPIALYKTWPAASWAAGQMVNKHGASCKVNTVHDYSTTTSEIVGFAVYVCIAADPSLMHEKALSPELSCSSICLIAPAPELPDLAPPTGAVIRSKWTTVGASK